MATKVGQFVIALLLSLGLSGCVATLPIAVLKGTTAVIAGTAKIATAGVGAGVSAVKTAAGAAAGAATAASSAGNGAAAASSQNASSASTPENSSGKAHLMDYPSPPEREEESSQPRQAGQCAQMPGVSACQSAGYMGEAMIIGGAVLLSSVMRNGEKVGNRCEIQCEEATVAVSCPLSEQPYCACGDPPVAECRSNDQVQENT